MQSWCSTNSSHPHSKSYFRLQFDHASSARLFVYGASVAFLQIDCAIECPSTESDTTHTSFSNCSHYYELVSPSSPSPSRCKNHESVSVYHTSNWHNFKIENRFSNHNLRGTSGEQVKIVGP